MFAYDQFLNDWFGLHGGREVLVEKNGYNNREFIEKPDEIWSYVETQSKRELWAYMSVQPYRNRDVIFGLEKLFFDFDCKGCVDKAWKEAHEFASSLIRHYCVKPFVAFSGHKGYHVYVFLKRVVQFPTWRNEFIKEVYGTLQRKLLKGHKFETLDEAVVGDVKRLARIPYTTHEETGELCQPLNLDRKPITIHALEEYRDQGLDHRLVELACKEVMDRREWREKRAEWRRRFRVGKTGKVRPCIEAALNAPLHGGEGHLMRLAVATEYLNRGFSVSEVVTLFSSQVDFNEFKTRYYVEDAKRKGYKPFKCATIRSLGFCLGDKCPIYRKRLRNQ